MMRNKGYMKNNCNIVLSRSKGFTLLELMIGLAIGLFITTVAITYLVASSKSFRVQNDDGRIQENARFALDLLTMNVRLAGFSPDSTRTVNSFFSTAVCPDDDGNGAATACTLDDVDEGGNSDRMAVELITRPGSDGNGCTGNNVGVGVRIANVFWVGDLDGDQVSSLNCWTYNIDAGAWVGATLPLIDGIDAMQVQYGEDSDNDGVVETYASFANVVARANTDSILSVRIALLSNSGLQQNTEQPRTRTYTLLDGPVITYNNDRTLREIYSTTILLTNANQGT